MTYEKWHPLKELDGMRKEMERIWEEVFPPQKRVVPEWRPSAEKGTVAPAIDIIERPGEVVVRAEMPGVLKEDINVTLDENALSIKGEIKTGEDKEESCSYSERNYRFYARTIKMPFQIKAEQIRATIKDGILSIHLPKVVEEAAKKINIAVS